ncbi:MAG: restriction endonuclease subunit S [Armatimonadota bacterium]
MTPKHLITIFDRISDAPDAIPRLRQFVLDLAVRGKLAEQDPNDEPAIELLKRIQAEKMRLVKVGEIKKEKLIPPITRENITFELPTGWTWTPWNSIALKIGDIDHCMPETVKDGVPFVSPRDFLSGNQIDFDNAKRVSRDDFLRLSAKMKPTIGDLIYPRYGTIGENRLVEDSRDFIVSYSCAVIKVLVGFIDPKYQYLFSISPFCRQQAKTAENKTTQANVGIKSIQEFVFPLPPLREQHRIVAKVDELMALCDQLAAAQAKRESRRDRLAAASLQRLHQPTDTEAPAFHEHARFYLNHLPRLTTRPEHIQQLRQTILSLAVRGKLVEQNPNDEPAPELLKRIMHVKKRLLAAKELRQSTSATNSIARRDEIAIPPTWTWGKCEDILFVTKLAGFEYTKHFGLKSQGDIPVVRAQNVKPWRLDRTNLLYIDRQTSDTLDRSALTKPCLLVTFIGAGIGDVAPFNEETRWHLAPNVAKIELFPGCDDQIDVTYLLLVLNSPFGRAEIFKHLKATAQPSISMGTIRDIDFPIAPLAEQRRIVAKVDELMELCDQLEAQLTTAQTASRRLLEAVLYEALSYH